jgi:hypothetical protein
MKSKSGPKCSKKRHGTYLTDFSEVNIIVCCLDKF